MNLKNLIRRKRHHCLIEVNDKPCVILYDHNGNDQFISVYELGRKLEGDALNDVLKVERRMKELGYN